ncbi:hypothetical protein BaRGS_00026208 [Batillaria attramentaria]|uniref:AAA+ ATPase domain-containing protein n=1 Tax=Batillaria attramentaria TaxID=370345 RepID=A0ABD0K689_9CAEN
MAETSTPRARSKHEKNASKQKNKPNDWYQCVSCRRVVHSRDTVQHEEACRMGQKLEHGYIMGGILHAIIASPSALPEEARVPSSRLNDVVYVHPSAVPLCGLACGFPCLVNRSHVLLAWSCDRLPPVSVVLPAAVMVNIEGADEGRQVTVERFSVAGQKHAQRVDIVLRPAKGLFYKSDFVELLPCLMEGRYVAEETVHTVSYLGHSCTFDIKMIEHRQPQVLQESIRPDSSKDERELNLDLSALNISETSDRGDVSVTDTCVSPGSPASESLTDNSASPLPKTLDVNKKSAGQFCTPVLDRKNPTPDSSLDRFVLVTAETEFVIVQPAGGTEKREENKFGFDSIGGLDSQIQRMRDLSKPLLQASQRRHTNGTGKTMLAQAMANDLPVFTVEIPVHSIWSKIYGETERKLCALFQTATERAPSLIIMDNLDALCPRAGAHQTDLEKRVATTVLSLLDGVLARESNTPCIVLGITNDPNSIDPALRRPGRLDNEIQTDKKPHSLPELEIKNICDATHGFVGADLFGLVKEACIHAIKRCGRTSPAEKPVLGSEDLMVAMKRMSPSVMKEMQLEVPHVRWSDIGGQTEVKEKLWQAVEWPLKHPEAFTRLGIPPPRGLLMYGPPGCSKTMVAKALATESGLNFLAVKGSELFSKWVGESEQAVRTVFQKARAAAPSIIFFDEIDALAVERGRSSGGSNVADRVLTQLLTEMDGVEGLQRVFVVAATNRPDMIDKALLRPGRFDNILYVSLPDATTRREILQIELRNKPTAADVSVDELVRRTEGYSGAELTALCNGAAVCALEEEITAREIRMHHFVKAMTEIVPGTNPSMVKLYERFSQQPDLKAV